ncbi:PIN domain-containing protein [Candidatus Shapirobacteria bacterium]|nr:PIN domain-containing protein [Candidatus Shapirobacteria bacterium]
MVILDTSIIIDHLRQTRGESRLMRLVKKMPKESLAISMVSIQELYEGKSTKNKNKEQLLLATIAPLKILPYSYEIAKLAGEIARDLKRPIEMADAVIAATAIINRASLFTIDEKDFQGIEPLEIIK